MLPPRGTVRIAKSIKPIDDAKAIAKMMGITEEAAAEALKPRDTLRPRANDDSSRSRH